MYCLSIELIFIALSGRLKLNFAGYVRQLSYAIFRSPLFLHQHSNLLSVTSAALLLTFSLLPPHEVIFPLPNSYSVISIYTLSFCRLKHVTRSCGRSREHQTD